MDYVLIEFISTGNFFKRIVFINMCVTLIKKERLCNMSIGSVSFNGAQKLTPAGNPYKKTNANKIAGTVVGGALGTAGAISIGKALKNPEVVKSITENLGESAPIFTKLLKKASVKGAVILAGVGLAIGAIVDACVNAHRKNKADKAAQAAQLDAQA